MIEVLMALAHALHSAGGYGSARDVQKTPCGSVPDNTKCGLQLVLQMPVVDMHLLAEETSSGKRDTNKRVALRHGVPKHQKSKRHRATCLSSERDVISGTIHNRLVSGFSITQGTWCLLARRQSRTTTAVRRLAASTLSRLTPVRVLSPYTETGSSPRNGGGPPA